jgi:integrase
MADSKDRRTWGTGSLVKRKKSPYWYVRYYDVNGKRRTESTGTTKRSEAERILRERLSEKARGENPDADRVTFEDMLDLYLNDRAIRGRRSRISLKHLKAAFGGRRARQMSGIVIGAFERQRLDSGAARATVNNELAVLRRMFNLASEKGLITRVQVPKIRTPDPKNARQGFFELDDFQAVMAELVDHLRPVMWFGYYTGWRVRSEVLPLQWRQVDFGAGIIRLEPNTTKNNEGREFPFSPFPALRALLEQQRRATTAIERREGRNIPWVFHNEGQSILCYRTGWEAACRRASEELKDGQRVITRPHLRHRLVHDLRRTAVRNLERAGVPRSVAMKLTGHKTESVYRRYAIVAKADLEAGVAKLASLQARLAKI